MTFSITARYPLGTYRGRRQDLSVDRIPSVARLHSALLAAAGFGPRARERDGEYTPCDVDDVALRWLEENPPDEVCIPQILVCHNAATAFREDGTIRKSGGVKQLRKLPKNDSAVAVGGPFVWTWHEPPPQPVAEALAELCPDVPHLGTAESPVVLTATREAGEAAAATHEYVPDADLFTPGSGADYDLDLPASGRVTELVAAHHAERTGKPGSGKAGTDERARSTTPPRRAVRSGRYRSTRQRAEVPWPEVLLVPLDKPVAERDRVRVAVAAHRALIKQLDREAPPILTGAYSPCVRRPANRVALQILHPDLPVRLPGSACSALAVMLPAGADPAALQAVYRAVGALRSVHPGRSLGKLAVTGTVEVAAGDRLWDEPQPGTVRLWRTNPAAVPDTRGRHGWTFTHAALLSLGFVWQGRSQIGTPVGRGAERDNGFVDAVNATGAVVLEATPLRTTRVGDYVHRTNPHAVVRPYQALLALGDLTGPGTIQAIGQCRHLGGGLLVPEDRAEGDVIGGDVS